jgi:hypothetical protein
MGGEGWLAVWDNDPVTKLARISRMPKCTPCLKAAPRCHTPNEQTALQRRITAKGRQIDALFYKLYALRGEEIGIVVAGG